jgi:hypothetical protein
MWTVFASSTVDTLPELVEGIGEELDRFLDGGFDTAEAGDSVAQLRGALKLDAMDIEHRMRRMARQFPVRSAADV